MKLHYFYVSVALAICAHAAPASITVAPDFESPVVLPSPVNLSGWEDSAHISPDGARLYFSYFRVDPVLIMTTGRIRLGDTRPGWPAQPAYAVYGAEIYMATNQAGVWQVPQNLGTKINLPEDAEGEAWVSEDDQRILFTNGDGSPSRPSGIYYSWKVSGAWSTPVPATSAGFPFLPGDENPHLTRDEQTLFFESRRAGGYGREDIWMARKVNGAWTAPVNLGPAVNTGGVEGSPFSLDGSVVYFDDKGSGGGIFRCRRQPDGTYAQRELVIAGNAGDPSLNIQGDLYFMQGSTIVNSLQQITGYVSSIAVAKTR